MMDDLNYGIISVCWA